MKRPREVSVKNRANKSSNSVNYPTDFEIIVNGQTIPCHRFLLCHRLEYFNTNEEFVSLSGEKTNNSCVLEIQVPFDVVFQFVEYLYGSKLEMNETNVVDFMLLADYWSFSCVEFDQKLIKFLPKIHSHLPPFHRIRSFLDCSAHTFITNDNNEHKYGNLILSNKGGLKLCTEDGLKMDLSIYHEVANGKNHCISPGYVWFENSGTISGGSIYCFNVLTKQTIAVTSKSAKVLATYKNFAVLCSDANFHVVEVSNGKVTECFKDLPSYVVAAQHTNVIWLFNRPKSELSTYDFEKCKMKVYTQKVLLNTVCTLYSEKFAFLGISVDSDTILDLDSNPMKLVEAPSHILHKPNSIVK